MKHHLLLAALLLVALPLSGQAQKSGPPALCKPCLFYAGDIDTNNMYATIFYDENTLAFPQTKTYASLTVPKGRFLSIEGILFQIMLQVPPDPKAATWEIRTGDIFADGGTLVASLNGPVSMQPTGRFFNQYSEYTMVVRVNPPVQVSGGSSFHGTRYWFNLTPQCTNQFDRNCGMDQYFVSNLTFPITNGLNAEAQLGAYSAIESFAYPYSWENWCSILPSPTCGKVSYGLLGKVVQ